MADAMVTGRMSKQKKRAGNAALAQVGVTPSAAINQMYDYVIEHRSLPFQTAEKRGLATLDEAQLREAVAVVCSLPRKNRFSTMDDDAIA